MLRSGGVLAALLALAGCARRDLDGMCKLASEILVEPRITRDQRVSRFTDQVPNVVFGMGTRRVLGSLSEVPPERRYELLVAFAHEEGLESWSCPSLEHLFTPPAETSN